MSCKQDTVWLGGCSARGMASSRSINWVEHSNRAIQASVPQTIGCSDYLTEKLCVLFLQRLPQPVAQELLEMLPDRELTVRFDNNISSFADRSIGYPDFVEAVFHGLGVSSNFPEDQMGTLAEQVADTFLWAVIQEIPTEMKSDLLRLLPADLKSRMNLYSGYSEESKVA